MKITIETKEKEKTVKKRKEYSKNLVTSLSLYLLTLVGVFTTFVCFMMYKTGDLSPVGYIAPALFAAFAFICAVTVSTYMWRAKQKDYVELDIQKNKQLSEMKKAFGEDFVYEQTPEMTQMDYNG